MKAAVIEVVKTHFRPEFINRVDESVIFHPLGVEQISGIAAIQADLEGDAPSLSSGTNSQKPLKRLRSSVK